jgi:hypothetical protein
MDKVKGRALQTLRGEYGRANIGEVVELPEKHAKQLEAKGLLEILGSSENKEVKQKKETSFRIKDNTQKQKEKAEVETDESNPTGVKEKAEKASTDEKEKNESAGPSLSKAAAAKKPASKKALKKKS